jgi:hypothetical protein
LLKKVNNQEGSALKLYNEIFQFSFLHVGYFNSLVDTPQKPYKTKELHNFESRAAFQSTESREFVNGNSNAVYCFN